jgi:CHAT domain-containing protein
MSKRNIFKRANQDLEQENQKLDRKYWKIAEKHLKLAQAGENIAINLKIAVNNCIECERIARRSNFTKGLATALNILGFAYMTLAKIGEAPAQNLGLAIEAYRKEETLYRDKNLTEKLTDTLNILGFAYMTLAKIGEAPAQNLGLAIEVFREEETLYRDKNLTEKLTDTLNNLGFAYMTLAKIGEAPAQNLELAIEFHRKEKMLYRDKNLTEKSALVPYKLGLAYMTLAKIGEAPAQNLDLAIEFYREAETLQRDNNWTESLTYTLNNLGFAYMTLAKIGEAPAQNLELAIEAYREAETLCRDKDLTKVILNNLGNAYRDLVDMGEAPARNLGLAIEVCRKAETLYRDNNLTKDLMSILNYLGNSYVTLADMGEAPARNLGLAIEVCREAETLCRDNKWPEDLALSLSNLGNAYLSLGEIREAPARNLGLAIEVLRQAETLRRDKNWTKSLTRTLNNLGIAYKNLADMGEAPARNLELAIEVCREAETLCRDNNWTKDLTSALTNLGNAYLMLTEIREANARDLEVVVEFYQEAEKSQYDNNWIENLTSDRLIDFDIACRNLAEIKKEIARNLEVAIEVLRETETLQRDNNWTKGLTFTLNSLGNAYLRLANMGEAPAQNLELAIEVYREAETLQRDNNWTKLLTLTLHNLSSAYLKLAYMGEAPAQNLEVAFEVCRETETLCRDKNWTFDLAVLLVNLGKVYHQQAQLTDESTQHCQRARDCYREALNFLQPTLVPADCLNAARALGDLAFEQKWWKIALEGYGDAVMAIEQMRTSLMNEDLRQRLIDKNIGVYKRAIQAAAELGWYDRMVDFAEWGRSRQLVDTIYSQKLPIGASLTDALTPLRAKLQHIQNQIDSHRPIIGDGDNSNSGRTISLRGGYRQLTNEAEIAAELQQLHTEYLQTLAEIRKLDPVYAQQIAVNILDFEQIRKLLPNPHTAILYCYTTDDHTYIIPICAATDSYIHTAKGEGYQNFQIWLNRVWEREYAAIDNNGNSRHEWHERMPDTLAEISRRLQLEDVCRYLSQHQIEELIVVPHLELHQIPWAAIPLGDGLLGERFALRTIPSCQMLDYFPHRQDIPDEELKRVTFENPDSSLIGAEYEGEKVSKLLGIEERNRYIRDNATLTNYLAALKNGENYVLSSLHGCGNRSNPIQSALLLANEQKITVGMLLVSRFPQLSEVFLSACETHTGRATIADDLVTLSTGFLSAGANNVISTLWAVDDLASALLSIFYHRSRHAGSRPAIALQAAQTRLRTISGEIIKAVYYKELMAHVEGYAEYTFEQKDRYDKGSAEADRWDGYNANAGRMRRRLQEIVTSETPPFESPWYWAGFICQGKG